MKAIPRKIAPSSTDVSIRRRKASSRLS